MSEHVSSDTARKMIADPYCPITTRCLAEDVLAAREERDKFRREVDIHAHASREARATLDAVAALVGGGDVVARVADLVMALEQREQQDRMNYSSTMVST